MSGQNPKKSAARTTGEQSYHTEQLDMGGADRHLLWRLWHFVRPYKARLFTALALMPLASGVVLLQPHLLQIAVDEHLAPRKLTGLAGLVALFAFTIVFRFVAEAVQYLLLQWVGLRTLADLRVALFRHVSSLEMRFFHRRPVGRLMTRLTTDVDSLQDAVSSGMVTILGDIFTLTAIVVILLVKSWVLALVTFTCVPILFGLSVLFRVLLRRAFQVIRVKIARLNAYLQEAVSGMSIIQLFNRQARGLHDFEEINRDHRNAQYRQIRWDAMLYAVVEAIGSVAVALIIWYGSGIALDGVVTLGVLIAFVDYTQKFFIPIRDLSQKYAMYQGAMASAERIFGLFDRDDRLSQAPDGHTGAFKGDIEFRDVWFAYRDDNWVLKGVSFKLSKGERVALVGHTGAGKSTIIGLLTRTYDVNRGQILIDGIDIREWNLHELRRKFGMVLQDPILFSGTIARNIHLGDDRVSSAIVNQAADAVHVSEFTAKHGAGLDLPVAERGANLSAGEKQLVTFARALARDPEVLILDEATANVDTETEALIQDAVKILLANRTSLVIAHRLSTIREVDNILVLHKGELVEQGSHDELLAHAGLYAKLHRLQYQLAA